MPKMTASPQVASRTVRLCAKTTPGYTHADGLTEESARLVSELLTTNHASYHTRWKGTFHNHIVHHLLALWALGATPDEIQYMWEYNTFYQTPVERPHGTAPVDLDLSDPVLFKKCLGNDDFYADFLKFFENEIAEKGVPAVLREYLLKGDERANDIFCRMYTDLVHPMIHLGCGLEFNQPSIVAEALAGACVHVNYPAQFLLPTEEYVKSNPGAPTKSLLQILEGLHQDPEISSGVRDTDPFNKIPDGLLKRVTPEKFVPYLSEFRVQPTEEDLQRKMSEVMHTCAYVLGAAQRPGKSEKMDFVILHGVTLTVFYPAILAQDWLTNEEKARLLEAKARVDAVLYAGCRTPTLYPSRIVNYEPRHPDDGWTQLFHRSIIYPDEGHVVKVIRALFSLEQLSESLPSDFPIMKKDFFNIAHMAVDTVETAIKPDGHKMPADVSDAIEEQVGEGGEMVTGNMKRFVFYGGLDKAWDFVPDLGEPVIT
ncbi:hypothetical protein AAE478_005340 [Parahypoxylon ruwenzoriense]